MIEFRCNKCGKKFEVPETHAGKKGRCPKCKNIIVVPQTEQINAEASKTPDLMLLDVPEEYKLKDKPVSKDGTSDQVVKRVSEQDLTTGEKEVVGQRNLTWFIDIFLYSTSVSGLTHLAIFTVIPLLIDIVRLLLGRFGMVVVLPGFIVNTLIGLYMGWYFTECVRDSAEGGTRAPEAFATADLGEMWLQFQHVIGCYLILLGPALFYRLYAQRTDIIFWLLIVYGVFFFPMGLLACIMFNSVSGLNPILLVGSIFRTFFQYIGLVLLILSIILIFYLLTGMIELDNTQQAGVFMRLLKGLFYFFFIYTAFVIAHLIGRFYWQFQEKLNWEV